MNSATSSSARALLLWKQKRITSATSMSGAQSTLSLNERKEYRPYRGKKRRYHPREVKIDTVTFGRDSQRA